MTAPVRLQLSRRKGFNLQALSLATNGLPAVNVARPSVLGNPFVCTAPHDCLLKPCDCCQAERCCVMQFDRYIEAGIAEAPDPTGSVRVALDGANGYPLRAAAIARLPSLRGCNVACWCGPDRPCHGDIWLKYANKVTT